MDKTNNLEMTALQLKSLLTIIAGVDTDNAGALAEIPIVSGLAQVLADNLYCAIVEKEI